MLPQKFKWLETIGPLPKLLQEGLKYLGVKEVVGHGSNSVIMDMADILGVRKIYVDDDMSWCALFMCYLCLKTKKPMPFKDYEILRAASFSSWGYSQRTPQLGDVLVFKRPGGNHVGLYIAETKSNYIVYGGNQSNQVGFTEIEKHRMTHCRRFYATNPPASVKRYEMNSSGIVSTNEA